MSSTRLNKYDTLKGILILLVLLGHIIGDQGGNIFSKIVVFSTYAFHMPLFMTITGKFAKFKPFDALLYIALFFVFDAWFVFTTGIFYLLIPLFARITSRKMQLVTIGITVIIGLLSGFLPLGTENEAIARCMTFLPYFLLGYYNVFEWKPIKHKILPAIPLILFTVFALPVLCGNALVPLFMCDQYGHHTIVTRCMVYVLGMIWTWWILNVTTNENVPVFTKLGRSTLWIYLLHEPMQAFLFPLLIVLNQRLGIQLFSIQALVAVAWCLLLWPVAILFQKGTIWLLRKLKPLNEWCQRKFMPQQKS
ncbi:MAG: acyltransferase [Bacteroidaceae bacterium]|nr:acyltransferase [Bacteroidaceae bacterium]